MTDKPAAHPEPPGDLAERSPFLTQLAAGTILSRIHRHDKGAVFFGKTSGNRFDSPDGSFGVLYVEGTMDAHILQRREMPTDPYRPFDQSFVLLASLVKKLIEESGKAGREVKALSVSVGGPLRIEEGVLLDPPHLPGWHNVRLKEALREAFRGLPVFVEHDGNAGALAEFYFGVGRTRPGLKHLVFLTFGTGLRAGLIVNGQIVHGASDTAGYGEERQQDHAENGPHRVSMAWMTVGYKADGHRHRLHL